MLACKSFIRFGRLGSYRSGEVSNPLGLFSASKCSSSYRIGISQNSRVTGAESLIGEFFTTIHAQNGFVAYRSRSLIFPVFVALPRNFGHGNFARGAPTGI